MFKPMQSILFATDLSENCLHALETSMLLAKEHNASIILLHVTSKNVPEFIESDIRSMLGEEKWKAINEKHKQESREALIGKMTSSTILEKVRKQFCEDLGLEEENMGLDWQDIVVADKHVASAILAQAKENKCDLIVLGVGRGFWGDNSVGSTIKGVMQHTDIPVMLVP